MARWPSRAPSGPRRDDRAATGWPRPTGPVAAATATGSGRNASVVSSEQSPVGHHAWPRFRPRLVGWGWVPRSRRRTTRTWQDRCLGRLWAVAEMELARHAGNPREPPGSTFLQISAAVDAIYAGRPPAGEWPVRCTSSRAERHRKLPFDHGKQPRIDHRVRTWGILARARGPRRVDGPPGTILRPRHEV